MEAAVEVFQERSGLIPFSPVAMTSSCYEQVISCRVLGGSLLNIRRFVSSQAFLVRQLLRCTGAALALHERHRRCPRWSELRVAGWFYIPPERRRRCLLQEIRRLPPPKREDLGIFRKRIPGRTNSFKTLRKHNMLNPVHATACA